MLEETYCAKISDDWITRERELREMDKAVLRLKNSYSHKSAILIIYSHWEGYFKFCADTLADFMEDGVERKIFRWTDMKEDVRQRIFFCSYRKSSIGGQSRETFIQYLSALSDPRFSKAFKARDEIILADDNLNTSRAEAICHNFGMDASWVVLKKIIIDERLLKYRNAIAHGSPRLRTGDILEVTPEWFENLSAEMRYLIRETKNRFTNAIMMREFLTPTNIVVPAKPATTSPRLPPPPAT